MLLCDYCGDEIVPNSERVIVYQGDKDVSYVSQGGHAPDGCEQVTVSVHGDKVVYTRRGSTVPRGFESVSVYIKEQGAIYTRGSVIPTGFIHVSVYVKKECVNTVPCIKPSKPKEALHIACLTEHIPRCEEAVAKFKTYVLSPPNTLSIGINVKYLYGVGQGEDNKKKKREKRDLKLRQLLQKVSALRNSNSGYILIHLVGLAPGDSFTGAFDEFVDTKLQDLIHDGQLFTHVYRKEKLSHHGKLSDFHDFLALYVSASAIVTTFDFNTKLALDDCIVDIPAETLRTFITERGDIEGQFDTEHTEIKTIHDVKSVHENRSIQLKSHFLQKKGDQEIVSYIIKSLKLTEYVSALCKLERGGSFLYGVKEECVFKTEYGYESKEIRLQPVRVDHPGYLKDILEGKISDTVLVSDFDGKQLTDRTVDVRFIPCPSDLTKRRCSDGRLLETGGHFIIHILVKPVNGVVFYDPRGPLAYRYDPTNKSVTRMEFHDWFRAFTKLRGD